MTLGTNLTAVITTLYFIEDRPDKLEYFNWQAFMTYCSLML